MKMRLITSLGASALLIACGARRIPGTEIDDNDDTRAILNIMEQYRIAVEARDADGVLRLVSETFKDEGGTARPEDRMDYATLQKKLPQQLAKLEDVKLDLNVRKIQIYSENSTASAVYTYNLNFKIPRLSNKIQSESEIKEMWFRRDKGGWKIFSGI